MCLVSCSSPVRNRLVFLHHTAEYQSGRFTVGPFCMSRLLQLFVTPCQGSSARSSAPTEACELGLACKCVHDSGLSGMYVFVYLLTCSLACWRVSAKMLLLLSRASLRAMPWARKQDASREGNCVYQSVCITVDAYLQDCKCVFICLYEIRQRVDHRLYSFTSCSCPLYFLPNMMLLVQIEI